MRFATLDVRPDGSILMGGSLIRADRSSQAIFAKLDGNGTLIEMQSFDATATSTGGYLISPTGDVYLTGLYQGSPYLAKLDGNGAIAWSQQYTSLSSLDVEFAEDGRIAAKGTILQQPSGPFPFRSSATSISAPTVSRRRASNSTTRTPCAPTAIFSARATAASTRH